ncbi:conserved hypothetical protein [Histoplasma capsulatum var. duboisii H88]|uniref:Uncharacterized protein n=1 Tax=Ajellomyces capsulatus (strain H88) TaxID=544711 RepID=F0U9T7_AJEC8|nr:conserved hypothetical protein [Histoplasma capsulatum var. duboisii H88]
MLLSSFNIVPKRLKSHHGELPSSQIPRISTGKNTQDSYNGRKAILRALFKCTDNQDRNIILSTTHEYRYPTIPEHEPANPTREDDYTATGVVKADMTSRYIGLVVVPGHYITKIELDEYSEKKAGIPRRNRLEDAGQHTRGQKPDVK